MLAMPPKAGTKNNRRIGYDFARIGLPKFAFRAQLLYSQVRCMSSWAETIKTKVEYEARCQCGLVAYKSLDAATRRGECMQLFDLYQKRVTLGGLHTKNRLFVGSVAITN
jgi:hypothetical protein